MAINGRTGWMQSVAMRTRPVARWALNLLMPPSCPVCRAPLGRQDGLCGACWGKLNFVSEPLCVACGIPFEFSAGHNQICAACAATPPAVAPVRAATVYNDGAKSLILPLKHADRLDLAPLMARLMFSASRPVLEGAHYLVPTPSHWTRLVHRRANQAAEIARAMSVQTGVEYAPWALTRVKKTPLQGTYGGLKGRARNVQGAFKVPARAASRITGKRVVLVDDVWTTGATVNACGQALLRAGAAQVAAVTFARVVRPANLDL